MMTFGTKEIEIEREDGSVYKATSYVSFNGSNIIIDNNCWQIVSGNKVTSHISAKAVEVLKQLPSNPKDYLLLRGL